MDTPRTLYKITQSSPGSEAAGEAAAALAAAYLVFRDDRDKTLATQLLAASRSVRPHVTPHLTVFFPRSMHAHARRNARTLSGRRSIGASGFPLHDLLFRLILIIHHH